MSPPPGLTLIFDGKDWLGSNSEVTKCLSVVPAMSEVVLGEGSGADSLMELVDTCPV